MSGTVQRNARVTAPKQMALPLPVRGGKRAGAGRKRGPNGSAGHHRRPKVNRHVPAHITLRVVRGLPTLRSERCLAPIRDALRAVRRRTGFRLVHFSVQHDHVHLVTEAASNESLARAMAGLCIRVARRLNRALGRSGKVFAARYHAVPLKSPKQTRDALAYVLLNGRHHAAGRGLAMDPGPVLLDPCSSAAVFDGWRPDVSVARAPPGRVDVGELVGVATAWILRVGWRRWGLIDPRGVPGQGRRGRRGRSPVDSAGAGDNPRG